MLQFLQDVMLSLGRPVPAQSLAPCYFQWPLVNRSGASASAATAREVLAGVIARQVQESSCAYLVLMGGNANTFVQAEGESLDVNKSLDVKDNRNNGGQRVKILRGPPLGKIFARPALKAELWNTLQPVYQSNRGNACKL